MTPLQQVILNMKDRPATRCTAPRKLPVWVQTVIITTTCPLWIPALVFYVLAWFFLAPVLWILSMAKMS